MNVEALLKDFVFSLKGIENLIIYETYSARESFNEFGSAQKLYQSCSNAKCFYDNPQQLKKYLRKNVNEGDIVLVLGAGNIYDIIIDCVN